MLIDVLNIEINVNKYIDVMKYYLLFILFY